MLWSARPVVGLRSLLLKSRARVGSQRLAHLHLEVLVCLGHAAAECSIARCLRHADSRVGGRVLEMRFLALLQLLVVALLSEGQGAGLGIGRRGLSGARQRQQESERQKPNCGGDDVAARVAFHAYPFDVEAVNVPVPARTLARS